MRRNIVGGVWVLVLLVTLVVGSSRALPPAADGPSQGGVAPVILVHGFLGFGRDEMGSLRYWGGTALDVQAFIREGGIPCFTASVGPVSSNHDRACELFAQIRGGRVDYGADHAATFGHERFGRTFEGFLGVWDESHPVDLVGHSMGGQTVRVLVDLLARDAFGVGSSARWVRSVTTIATPHEGTTLASAIGALTGERAEEAAAVALSFLGTDLGFYDFDLDQWGLVQRDGESAGAFLRRAVDSLGSTRDMCMYDLRPEGARALNEATITSPDVWYFSISTQATAPSGAEGHHRPLRTMLPLIRPMAWVMGRYEGSDVTDAPSWWANDGVVNTVSMAGPGTARVVENAAGPFERGCWNHLGTLNVDHGACIGLGGIPDDDLPAFKRFWAELAVRLGSLSSPGGAVAAGGPVTLLGAASSSLD